MLLLVLAIADMVSGTSQSAAPVATVAAIAAPAPPAAPAQPELTQPIADQPTAAQSTAAQSTESTAVPATAAGVVGDGPTPPALAAPAETPPRAAAPAPDVEATDLAQSGYMTAPRDPWVKANRAIFSFDLKLERKLLAPVAHGYVHIVPRVVRVHVTSALFNLEEPLTATNDLLQLRIGSMGKALFRFIVNSTIGIAGLFDVAKASGVPIHISDFGQTLARYGAKPGPYVMLPLLGPSNVRDGFGQLVDNFIDPITLLIGGITSPDGLSIFVLGGIDWRSRADETLNAVYSATDPYAFTRSAYSQFRAAKVLEATGKQAELPDFDAVPGTP